MSEVTTRYCPVCAAQTEASHCPNDGAATVVKQLFNKDALGFLPGDLVAQRYRIEGALGRGAYGAVYAARHTGTDQAVALKMLTLDTDGAAGDKHAQRFFREARMTAKLRHQHTVRVFDVGQSEEGPLFLAMELLRGPSLAAWLAREFDAGRKVNEAHTIDIAIAALKSLHEAHKSGLVHRDIKPGNIVLHRGPDDEAIVKVLDFGIARAAGSDLTQTGHSLGTPAYMSPEQCRGEELDGRSDLYAIGILMYLMVAGRLPFVSDDNMALLFKQVTEPAPDPRAVSGVHLTDAFLDTLMTALEKVADDRFADAKQMWQRLQDIRAAHHAAVTPFELADDDPLWTNTDHQQGDIAASASTQASSVHESRTRVADDLDEEEATAAVAVIRAPLRASSPPAASATSPEIAPNRDVVAEAAAVGLNPTVAFARAPVAAAAAVDVAGPAPAPVPAALAPVSPQGGAMKWAVIAAALVVAGGVGFMATRGGSDGSVDDPAGQPSPAASVALVPANTAPLPAPSARPPPPPASPKDQPAAKIEAKPVTAEQSLRKADALVAYNMSLQLTDPNDRLEYAKKAVRLEPENQAYIKSLVEIETQLQTAQAAKAKGAIPGRPAERRRSAAYVSDTR